MQARNLFVIVAFVLAIACILLARGAMSATEEAKQETLRCEARTWKRVLDIPKITLGLDIKFRGKSVIAVHEIEQDKPAIEALRHVLADERNTKCDPSKLCLDNIVVIQTWDSVNSHLITKITTTAWIAGYDVILAPPRNNTW